MDRVIFLLEEPSMKTLLDNFLPRVFPGLPFRCIAHEGKNDLESSIPRKLRGWGGPGVRFVILRDNDNADCYALKERLLQLCRDGGRGDALVRIVCQELEAWYLGQPDAMADAFGEEKLRRIKNRARYRSPDDLQKPSQAIKRLLARIPENLRRPPDGKSPDAGRQPLYQLHRFSRRHREPVAADGSRPCRAGYQITISCPCPSQYFRSNGI